MAQIKLSNCQVELIDQLTYGARLKLQEAVLNGSRLNASDNDMSMDGTALIAARYKAFEICITKVTDAEGNEKRYSRDWLDNLSVDDGETLFAAVEKITNPEKK